jgi:hypothetical protein
MIGFTRFKTVTSTVSSSRETKAVVTASTATGERNRMYRQLVARSPIGFGIGHQASVTVASADA